MSEIVWLLESPAGAAVVVGRGKDVPAITPSGGATLRRYLPVSDEQPLGLSKEHRNLAIRLSGELVDELSTMGRAMGFSPDVAIVAMLSASITIMITEMDRKVTADRAIDSLQNSLELLRLGAVEAEKGMAEFEARIKL